jgi:hypothetical protein
MKTTLTTTEAIDILRGDEFANWSYNGAKALVEWLEQYEDETGCEFDFCRVTLRCDFSEYQSLVAWADAYGADLGEAPEDDEERDEEIREYILERGQLIEFNGGVIVSEF